MKKKPTLKDMTDAAMAAGAKVIVSLAPKPMPPYTLLPGDHLHVIALMDRAMELHHLAEETAKKGNLPGAISILRSSEALTFGGAWLRCYLKGEFDQFKRTPKKKKK